MGEPARLHPRAERTRAALIAAGQQLFSERPADAVTVDEIVRVAEVGKGSFYNHFADREALVRAITAEIRAVVERAIDQANAGVVDPARRVARAACVYVRFALDEPERAAFLMRVFGAHTSLDAELNRGVVDDIGKGLSAGRFRIATLEAGVLYVLGVTQMTLLRIVQEPSAALAVSLAQQMCAMVLSGLRVPDQDADLIAAQASEEIVRAGGASKAAAPS
jgi:AcrR family transcriptional regulator